MKSIFWLLGTTTVLVPHATLAQQHVSIQIEGTIKPQCGFKDDQAGASTARTDFLFEVNPDDANWSHQTNTMALSMSCNAPFTLAVHSNHGRLKNSDAINNGIGGHFSNEIAYQLDLNMTTEDAAAPLTIACHSSAMHSTAPSCGATSGSNVAIGRGAGVGEVGITLSGSSGFPIRGRYQDTIILALALQ